VHAYCEANANWIARKHSAAVERPIAAGDTRSRCRRTQIIGRAGSYCASRVGNGLVQRTALSVVVYVFASFALTSVCYASKRPQATTPIILASWQLDRITALGTSVEVEAAAEAQGPTAITSTEGSIRVGQASILRIVYDPRRPAPARAKLLGIASVQLYFAQGRASATGATDPHVSVNIRLSGSFAFAHQVSETTATQGSLTQATAAFAIALVPGN
jgi:hypothetical protein